MKLKNISIAVAMALSMVAGFNSAQISHAAEIPAEASLSSEGLIITPYWTNISNISVSLNSNGTTLYPGTYIESMYSSASISGTMHLEREISPGLWAGVSSWGFSGTSYVFESKSYEGTSGMKYRVRAVVTVDGEKATAFSPEKQL